MNYALAFLGGLLIAAGVYVVGLQHSIKSLESMNSTLKTQLETCKAQQNLQNVALINANDSLKAYSQDLQKIRNDYESKAKELKTSLNSVKTCQEGMKYLENMLNELKGL